MQYCLQLLAFALFHVCCIFLSNITTNIWATILTKYRRDYKIANEGNEGKQKNTIKTATSPTTKKKKVQDEEVAEEEEAEEIKKDEEK